jgi:hypothetical protein
MNTILSKGRSNKVLKYILDAYTFSEHDYELLVSNSNIKNHEYFIPIIKYKFNLDPVPNLFEKATYLWKYNLQTHIKIDLDSIEEYLNIKDNILKDCIQFNSKTILNNNIFNILLENNYIKTVENILIWCPLIMDQNLLNLLIPYNIKLCNNETKIQFDCKDTMYNYIINYKYFDNNILKYNCNILKSDDDFNNLADLIHNNNDKINVSISDYNINKLSKGIFRLFLLQNSIDIEKLYDKFYKYQELWYEVDINKLQLGYANKYCNGISDILSGTQTVFNKIKKFISIMKGTHINNGYHRVIFKITDKSDILLYFDILFYKKNLDLKTLKEIKSYILKENQNSSDILKKTCDKLITILDKYINQYNKSDVQLDISNELPILID